jgi:hypothetical protein
MFCHTTEPKPDIKWCEADKPARQFTQWFYSTLNQHDVYHQGTQLGVENFWQDCNMQLVLNSEMGCSKTQVKNSAAIFVQLISFFQVLEGIAPSKISSPSFFVTCWKFLLFTSRTPAR